MSPHETPALILPHQPRRQENVHMLREIARAETLTAPAFSDRVLDTARQDGQASPVAGSERRKGQYTASSPAATRRRCSISEDMSDDQAHSARGGVVCTATLLPERLSTVHHVARRMRKASVPARGTATATTTVAPTVALPLPRLRSSKPGETSRSTRSHRRWLTIVSSSSKMPLRQTANG